jgi:uncharacterized membrane protein YdjX (TVP38/TMEM64 family)
VIGRAVLLIGLLAVSLAGLAIRWLWPEQIIGSAAEFFKTLRSLGQVGILIFALAQIAVAVTWLLPAALLGVVAGAVYGVMMGFVIAAVSTMLGAILGFLIARSALRRFAEQMLARYPTLRDHDTLIARDGWRSVCLLRVSPVMPLAVTSYALGLSSIAPGTMSSERWRRFRRCLRMFLSEH